MGIITKKKIGNAVKRNLIKRRIKNIMNEADEDIEIFDRFDVLTSTKGFPIKFNTKGEAIKFLGDLGMYIPEDSEEGEIQIDRLH